MPKHSFIMNLIRGLSGDSAKKLTQTGLEAASPYIGNLFLKGTDLLSKFAPSVAEKVLSGGLNAINTATKYLPSVIEGVVNAADATLSPNATVVPSYVEDRAAAVYPASSTRNAPLARGMGTGMLFFGNDQPLQDGYVAAGRKGLTTARPVINVDYNTRRLHSSQFANELPRVEYVPPVGKNSFGLDGEYLGDRNDLPSGAPRDASEAGWYFRKVGPNTNIVADAPGYGEIISPEEEKAQRKKANKKKKTEKKRKAKVPESMKGKKKR